MTDARELRSYGRTGGRPLSPRQTALVRELLPRVAIDPARPIVAETEPGRPLWLEIGFGGAEHLIAQARANPGVDLIGCEPFVEGVAKALAGIAEHGLGNVRLLDSDARPLLRCLPDASVDRAFVLFPDPWPKRKHQKRRLVNRATLAMLARVMRPGAELRIGTDIGDYVRTMMIEIDAEGSFRWLAIRPADWRDRPADWPQTRYEQKALQAGRRCYYFRFGRR